MELILGIGIMVLIIVLVFCLLNMSRDKRYHDEYIKMLSATLADRPDEYSRRINYTNDFLKYLDGIIASTTSIRFVEFITSMKNPDKIHRIKIEQLVRDISNQIFETLVKDNVNYNALLINTDYLTWYIVHLTIATVNNKFEKSLIEIIDDRQ